MPYRSKTPDHSVSEVDRLYAENRELRARLEQAEHFSLICKNAYEWTWELDAAGVYTFASPGVEVILGYKPHELIGKRPFDFMRVEKAPAAQKPFFETASAVEEEFVSKNFAAFIHKDGFEVFTQTNSRPFYNEEGICCGYRGVNIDRSEESRTAKNSPLQNTLHAQHQMLLNVTNSISDLLFYKDSDFRYQGCNEAFCDFLGLRMEQIIGKTDFDLFPKEYAELFRSMDLYVVEHLSVHSNYEWIVHADGRHLYLHTKKVPLLNENGKVTGMVGISRDLTKELSD